MVNMETDKNRRYVQLALDNSTSTIDMLDVATCSEQTFIVGNFPIDVSKQSADNLLTVYYLISSDKSAAPFTMHRFMFRTKTTMAC